MIALSHCSYTSVKNKRRASSVCGLVGLFGTAAVPPLEAAVLARRRDDAVLVVVNGAKGGKTFGFCEAFRVDGGVLGG